MYVAFAVVALQSGKHREPAQRNVNPKRAVVVDAGKEESEREKLFYMKRKMCA
jgi:hypothetical protein